MEGRLIGVDHHRGFFPVVQQTIQSRFKFLKRHGVFIKEHVPILGDREGDLFGKVVRRRTRFRQVDGHAFLQGHGQGGDHEKHQQKKHGVDHGNNFNTGFFLDCGRKFHEGNPAVASCKARSVCVA